MANFKIDNVCGLRKTKAQNNTQLEFLKRPGSGFCSPCETPEQWEQGLSLILLPALGNLSSYWIASSSLDRKGGA